MKRLFTLIIILAATFSKAQLADKAKHIEVAETIKKEYNAKNYKAIYSMLDDDFRKQIKENELADFFRLNIYEFHKEITSLVFVDFKKTTCEFYVECKKGMMNLSLACNAKGKISGMQWQPVQKLVEETKIFRNENYATDNPKRSDWDLRVDSIVKNYMLNSVNCGLSIAIYDNETISYYNYGESKRGSKELPSQKTIYEIGSVSKVFTGILLAQAVKDKKVNLNDDIRKYLQGDYNNLSYKGKAIELVHLANHSSRISRIPSDIDQKAGYDPLNPYKHYSSEMMFEYLKSVTLDTFPGTKSEYSNLGMALLGVILEKVYNKPYEELVTEIISKPLMLDNTKINLSDDEKKRFATGYNDSGNETPHWELNSCVAAGGIRSTASDLVHFIKANIEENNEALKLSHSTTYNSGRDQVGLAWQLMTTRKGNEMVWHNGGTFGASSFASFIKTKKIGVVVLSNSGNSVDQIALGIMKLLQ